MKIDGESGMMKNQGNKEEESSAEKEGNSVDPVKRLNASLKGSRNLNTKGSIPLVSCPNRK